MVRHVVVWTMQAGNEGDLDGLLEALRALPARVPEIEALSAGRLLNATEYDAALCVDVADPEALERYRAHPAHQPVVAKLREVAATLVVADYEV
jgi:hypothetical protein